MAEKTHLCNSVQEKLQKLNCKYVEKCKEMEILQQNYDDQKVLYDEAMKKLLHYEDLKSQHLELDVKYKKDVNSFYSKHQQVSKELDNKIAENEKLLKAHNKLEEIINDMKDVKVKKLCTNKCELKIRRQEKIISELKDSIKVLKEDIQNSEINSKQSDRNTCDCTHVTSFLLFVFFFSFFLNSLFIGKSIVDKN